MSSLARRQTDLPSLLPQGLQTSLQAGVILKEQPKPDSVQLIADLLSRVARIYQIPNWTPLASVELAEWTYDQYKFEGPEVVIKALTNPPAGEDRTWRLTPDTIAAWMEKALDKQAEQREREVDKMHKEERGLGELPNVDYGALQKRLKEEGIPKDRPKVFREMDEERYREEKQKWLKERKPFVKSVEVESQPSGAV